MNLISVKEISPGELTEHIRRNHPAVLRNAAPNWHARWTPEALNARIGAQPIQAETRETNPKERRQQTLSLSELLMLVTQRSSPYRVRSIDFFSQLPELAREVSSDNPFRALCPTLQERHYALWISPPDLSFE